MRFRLYQGLYLLQKIKEWKKNKRSRQKMQDLISVIVPVYKVEKYLKRCVDSILAQTIPVWK